MVTYEEVKEVFNSKNCQLLENEKDFADITLKTSVNIKLRYIASCGHEHIVFYNVFKSRNTGVKCPKCVHIINSQKSKDRENVSQDGQGINCLMEDRSVEYITSILNSQFKVKKTFEGCLADFMIKPLDIESDKWLMVQMKSTEKPRNGYSFHCSEKYKNCIILCLSWSDKRMWCFNGNNINVKHRLAIGENKSKYSQFEVFTNTINQIVLSFYKVIPSFIENTINTPISLFQIRERNFRKLREDKCSFIEFNYPDLNQLCYDFTINGKRIQEKVCEKQKGKHFVAFGMYKNNGLLNHKRQFKLYTKGDNDFYWLNFSDCNIFYVIPEKDMIENNYVSEKDIVSKKKFLCLNPLNKDSINYNWTIKYLFYYNEPDIARLIQLFV
jgi:hypothetical protein